LWWWWWWWWWWWICYLDAFKIIAGEKDYVTEKDLAAVLPPEKVAYLVSHMPPYPGVDPSLKAFDYKAYTDKIYA
jgi:hypothetical protein